MLKFTIDVNVVLTWMELQGAQLYEPAERLFRGMKKEEVVIYAPDFMLVELTNVLKWRYKISKKESLGLMKKIRESGIRFVPAGSEKMDDIHTLMYSHDLTAYDALYLYTAQKTGSKLVTTDPKLLKAKEWSIELVSLSGSREQSIIG